MSVKDRTYIFVTVVFLLVSGYFAFSNVLTRYSYYKQNLKYDTYFIENYHRQLTSRITKTLKSNLLRISSDNALILAIAKRSNEDISQLMDTHLNAIGYEYPSDFFLVNIVDQKSELIYTSNGGKPICSTPSQAAIDSITSKMNQTTFKVCSGKVLQFASSPIYLNGELIGAAETGISLDFYGNSMEQAIGYSMALLVHKSELTDNPLNYQSYGDYVVMHNNNQSTFKRIMSSIKHYDSIGNLIDAGGLSYRIIDTISFADSNGATAGRFIYAKDISDEVSWMRSFLIKTILMTVFFCGLALYVIRSGFTKTIGELEMKYEHSISDLELSEHKYKSYINNSPIAIFTTDHHKVITDINTYACGLWGFDKNEVTGKTLYQLFSTIPATVMDNFVKRVLFAGSSELNLTVKHVDGNHLYMLVKAVKLDDGNLLFNCQDITSSVNADKRLQELNYELEHINKTLENRINQEVEKNRIQTHAIAEQKKLADMGMMVSAIAHQWRQPLNALGILMQTLPDNLGIAEDDEKVKSVEETSMTLISQMSDTIDNFRNFFESGKQKEPINVIIELKHTMEMMSAKISSTGTKLKYVCRKEDEDHYHNEPECGQCFNYNILGHTGEFRQIIINILYNSLDAIETVRKANSKHDGEITIIMVCGKNRISIAFEDNGTGAKEEVLERIFEPYYSTKDDSKSSGIGLYIVKILTEQSLKGRVSAFNNHKNGLSVVIDIPVIDV